MDPTPLAHFVSAGVVIAGLVIADLIGTIGAYLIGPPVVGVRLGGGLLAGVSALAVPVPTPAPSAPPGLAELADMAIGWLKWALIVCGVGGLMLCGIMMTIGRRNRSAMAADGASGIPWVLGGLACGVVAASVVAMIVR